MPEPVTLYVCTTCRAAGDTAEPRAGTRLLAALAQALEERVAGHPYIEALVLAILVGIAVRTAWTMPAAGNCMSGPVVKVPGIAS